MKVTFETENADSRMASIDDILDLIIDYETETQDNIVLSGMKYNIKAV